jgi:hypothetical protein
MTDTLPDKDIRERLRALQRERHEILALPPEEALNRILSAPQPAALVHSIPESDLYLLVHDIGPEDALPLLALASDKQWDHIVDLESWAKDRIEVHSVTRWLNLLLESDPQRFLRWFLKDHLEFVEFYLFQNIEVRVLEHDQDPSEFGDDFFTLDGTYFIRFLKLPPVLDSSAIGEEERKEFLMKLLQRLSAHDHLVFINVLLEATHVIPAETEEEEYHWRTVHLAEKGSCRSTRPSGSTSPSSRRTWKSGLRNTLRAGGRRVLRCPCHPTRCGRWRRTTTSAAPSPGSSRRTSSPRCSGSSPTFATRSSSLTTRPSAAARSCTPS